MRKVILVVNRMFTNFFNESQKVLMDCAMGSHKNKLDFRENAKTANLISFLYF